MTSTKSSPKPKEKASSSAKERKSASESKLFRKVDLEELLSRDPLDYDLLAQLTHMSALSTSGMSRSQLFEGTAALSYSTSKFFRQVYLVAQRLNYDYSRACEVVADRIKENSVRNLLLHFSTALSSGEKEEDFLMREAALQREMYGKEYERKIESLQKWSDAYVALMVSATLVVVISLVSMMIYPFSPITIIGLAGLMICVTFIGGWLIYTVSPINKKTHPLKHKSVEQVRIARLARYLIPGAVIVGAAAGWTLGMPYALLAGGLMIAPVGVLAMMDDWKIDSYDRDIPAFIRGLGGVMAAAGMTATDGLSRLNRRSLGSLEPPVNRLYVRLKSGISPDLCWARLASETGSDLVVRCVRIFWDGVRVGGDTAKVSTLASEFALKIWLLRADRKLVSTTFSWVAVPMHAVLMGILLFITEVVQVFGGEIGQVQQDSLEGGVAAEAGVGDALLFQFSSLEFIPPFVAMVALMLTAANSFAPYAAGGGHGFKLCLYAAIMMIISGLAFIFVPQMVNAIFEGIALDPNAPGAATDVVGGA